MEKSSNKKWFKLGGILYIVILLLVVVATFSWFMLNREATIKTAEDNLIVTSNSANLEISLTGDDDTWGREIDLKTGPDITYIDITSDGEKFLYPTYLINGEGKDEPDRLNPDSFKDVTNEVNSEGDTLYYLTLKVHFKTSEAMDIYLANTSYVLPLQDMEPVPESGFKRQSTFGEGLNCDGIAGAARVAFLSDDENASLKLRHLWIPNDDYELYYDEENAKFSMNGSHPESSLGYGYMYLDGSETVKEYKYDAADYVSGDVMIGNDGLASASAGAAPTTGLSHPVLSFEKSNELEEKVLTIRVWFEGTDREADIALNGGAVKYRFDFVGVDKKDATADTQQKINGIKFEGSTISFSDGTPCYNKILYSFDGIKWNNYGKENPMTFAAGSKVYVRSIESATERSSAAKVLTK